MYNNFFKLIKINTKILLLPLTIIKIIFRYLFKSKIEFQIKKLIKIIILKIKDICK